MFWFPFFPPAMTVQLLCRGWRKQDLRSQEKFNPQIRCGGGDGGARNLSLSFPSEHKGPGGRHNSKNYNIREKSPESTRTKTRLLKNSLSRSGFAVLSSKPTRFRIRATQRPGHTRPHNPIYPPQEDSK